MTVRKSTRTWLTILAISIVLLAIDGPTDRLGFVGVLATLACIPAAIVVAFRAIVAGFRLLVRRLSLRLAFSYFLIGIVPIPLLAMLLIMGGYLLSFQFIGGRLRRETQVIAQETTDQTPGVQKVEVADGKVARSPLPWLTENTPVPWATEAKDPRLLLAEDRVWLASGVAPGGNGTIRLLWLQDPAILQRIADRTGYVVRAESATENRENGYQIRVGRPGTRGRDPDPDLDKKSDKVVRPTSRPKEPSGGFIDREGLLGISMTRPVAIFPPPAGKPDRIVAMVGHTSPRLLWEEFSSAWVPGTGRIVFSVMAGLAGALLFVYLVALALAFALVATITRNVNRMSRAAAGIARGDFSVRVNTRSRDQIGDLARSFDGMADSIQRLLIETARKERLEGEIAVARTIQQKLLPPASAELPGARVLAHVQSVAEIGGDYYDYLPVPDGRSAIVVGDVSGHGLPTGLLVAMAKAALATLIETGLTGPPLFARLNDLIHRSTDSRSYMTLTLFVYDATTRRGDLTNAGQLAPYRVSSGRVESLSLPSFPLGASPRSEFPTRTWDFAPGDRIVFLTDGLVECLSPSGDPFGFERFEAILAREARSTPSELKGAILSEIEKHTGGAAPDDDRTLVIVTLDPIEGPPPK